MRSRRRSPFLLIAALLVAGLPVTAGAQIPAPVGDAHAATYEPTPGDVFRLTINCGFQLSRGTGPQSDQFDLVLRADPTLTVPYVGEIDASELTFAALERVVTERLLDRLEVPFVGFVLAAPAAFDVLVWGSVGAPGRVRVTSLARLSDAIDAAAGVLPHGSARRIEIHRGNRISRHDLHGRIRRGDGDDPFLKPGDRVFVPAAQAFVEVEGAVASTGRYEVAPGATIADVIELAGGALPGARLDEARLTRIGPDGRYTGVGTDGGVIGSVEALAGDLLDVPSGFEVRRSVVVEGAIHHESVQGDADREVPTTPLVVEVAYAQGMTVLGLLERFGGPTGYADTRRSFILRADGGLREPIPDVQQLSGERRWEGDIVLLPGDRLVIPMRRLQVAVHGAVRAPGAFPFTSGFTVEDYVALAGGIERPRGSSTRITLLDANGASARVPLGNRCPRVRRYRWVEAVGARRVGCSVRYSRPQNGSPAWSARLPR